MDDGPSLGGGATRPSRDPRLWWVAAAGAVVLVGLAVHVAPWVTGGFGVSHDGYNGSMWGLNGRALWDDPLGSRLGGIQPDGPRYANHPPLIVWASALAGGPTDGSALALRTPALLASVASLVVLARLLLDAGLRALPVAGGILLAGCSSMFLTYGALLDTPVISLPLGLAVVAVAQRGWQGRPVPARWAVATAFVAGVGGWQAIGIAGVAVLACLLAPGRAGRRTAIALAAGVAGGTAATLAWITWVRGDLWRLVDQGRLRQTADGASWAEAQRDHLGDLFGPALLVLVVVGAVLALAGVALRGDDRDGAGASPWWRGPGPLVAVVASAVVGYSAVFRQASAEHDYWAFWGVALVAVSAATVLDVVVGALRRAPAVAGRAAGALVVVGVLWLAGAGLLTRGAADRAIQEGSEAAPVLASVPRASSPDQVTMAARHAETGAPWARFATRGTVLRPTVEEIADLPADLPLFIRTRAVPDARLRAVALAVEGHFVVLRAGDYREILGR